MYLIKNIFWISILLIYTHQSIAQDTLHLNQAIDLALQNNYGIKVAKNNAQIQKNNATRGNAGLLPSLGASAGITYSNQNINLSFSGDRPSVSESAVGTWNTAASLDAAYTIFDGLGSIRNYQSLILSAEQGEIQAKQTMEAVILQIANTYYSLAQLDESYQIALENLAISNERLARVKNKNEFGISNKLDVLNAEVDLNTDSVSALNAQVALANAQRDLNQLLGRSLERSFNVSKQISYQNLFVLENLIREAEAKNLNLKSAEYDQRISELNLKISEGSLLPRLNATASYGYNRNKTGAGLILVNRSLGFTGGLNLSFDIFNGNQKRTQIQNAKISQANTAENYQDVKLQIERDIRNAFAQYQNDLFVMKVEEKSVATAELNFERTREQFNFGQLTTTQFREAQLNLIQAKNRFNNARYTAKLSEINLLQLSGKILEKN